MKMPHSTLEAPAPDVSILIPTYDQRASIGAAIRSALAQTHASLEVVVADDCSSDGTFEAAAAIRDPRCRVVRNERNLGRVGNYRHLLHDLARGEWALVLDGDDELIDPEFLRAAMQSIRADASLVMVVGGMIDVSGEGDARTLLPTRRDAETVDGRDFFLGWRFDSVVPHLGTLYHRRRAMAVGFYDRDILSADWLSLRKLALEGRVCLLGRAVGRWHHHGSNISSTIEFEPHRRNLDSILIPADHARGRLLPASRVDAWRREALADYAFHYCRFVAGAGRLDLARRLALHVGTLDPAARRRLAWRLATSPIFHVQAVSGALGLWDGLQRTWRRLRSRTA